MAYRVLAGAVTVEMGIPGGRARQDVRRGEVLPADVPDAEVRELLARGDIEVDDADMYMSTEPASPSDPPRAPRKRLSGSQK